MVAAVNTINPNVPAPALTSAKGNTRPVMSGAVMEALGLIGDFKGAVTNTVSSITGLLGKRDPLELAGLGFASWVWIPLGGLLAKDAWDSDAVLKKIGDVWGRCIGFCRFMKGVGLTIGGTIFIPVRVLTVIASKVTLVVATHLSNVGSAFFAIANVFAVGVSTLSLSKSIPFYKEIHKQLADESLPLAERQRAILQGLKNRLEVAPTERLEIEQRVASEFPLAQRPAKITEALDLLVQKKEHELKRVCGGCVNRIRAATPEQAEIVIKAVLSANKEKIALDLIAGILSFIGAATTFIGFGMTGAAASLALQIISSISSMGWVAIDGYTWASAMKDNDHGRSDKATLIFNTILCLIAAGITVMLTSNPAIIIVALAFALVCTGVNVGTYLYHRK